MNHKEKTWEKLVSSIKIHRDIKARYFKPNCILAVCSLLDRGASQLDAISAKDVIDEFSNLTSRVFPDKASSGWMPLWHLMSDGAWECKKGDLVTSRMAFRLGKPRSIKETLQAVETIDCSTVYGELWSNAESRDQLRYMMRGILLEDKDVSANLMGEYLKALAEYQPDMLSEEFFENKLIPQSKLERVENYARYRVHLRLERDSSIARDVKQAQGFACLACGFKFEDIYGELGANYIEAHHVVPVTHAKGQKKLVSLIDDFIVLCANCHRMIHRLGAPWTRQRVDDLKTLMQQRSV